MKKPFSLRKQIRSFAYKLKGVFNGADGGNRTRDHHLTKIELSKTKLVPYTLNTVINTSKIASIFSLDTQLK